MKSWYNSLRSVFICMIIDISERNEGNSPVRCARRVASLTEQLYLQAIKEDTFDNSEQTFEISNCSMISQRETQATDSQVSSTNEPTFPRHMKSRLSDFQKQHLPSGLCSFPGNSEMSIALLNSL